MQDLGLQRYGLLLLGPILLAPSSSLNVPICRVRLAFGYVDNARALPTYPQAQQQQTNIDSMIRDQQESPRRWYLR
jgi:hypothetical protein